MIKNKKGISLVLLVLVVVITISLLAVGVVALDKNYNLSGLSAFSNDVKDIEDLAGAYIIENGPDSLEKISKAEVIDLVDENQRAEFNKELLSNLDQSENTFYLVDLEKIGVKKSVRGYSKNGIDDIYVMANDSLHAYYLKGLNVEDKIYFSASKKIKNLTVAGNTGEDSEEEENVNYAYYVATADKLLATIDGREYNKTNGVGAICALFVSNDWMFPILVSKDADAVKYTTCNQTFSSAGSVTYNGETYYYSANSYAMGTTSNYTTTLQELRYSQNYSDALFTQAVTDLLDKYYNVNQ